MAWPGNIVSPACAVLLAAAGLSAQEFRPLFDGASLKGWRLQGQGEWKAVDGVLVGTHAQSGKQFGHLVSDSLFGDFTFRYRWKLVRGNSGLYFRSAEGGEAGMIGPQVEMDAAFPGGIYTTNTTPWGWVAQPRAQDVPAWYKAGDWNLVTVTAKGPRVEVAYNGIRTAETSDARLPLKGRFGFQVHAGMDCEILIDDVEVSVPAPAALAPYPAERGGRDGRRPGGARFGRFSRPDRPGAFYRIDGARD